MSILKKLGRDFIFPFVLKTGSEKTFRAFTSHQILILNYHGVVKNYDQKLTKNHLPEEQFYKHLSYFKRNFDVISLSEAFSSTNQSPTGRKQIVITFDDGYENNFTSAYPALKEYNFPATIFVAAQAVENPEMPLWYDILDILNSKIGFAKLKEHLVTSLSGNEFSPESYGEFKRQFKQKDSIFKNKTLNALLSNTQLKECVFSSNKEYWKLLSLNQLQELAKSGLIEIGSHGKTHTNLNVLSGEALNQELVGSKSILEKACGVNISSIAFPDGAYNEEVKMNSLKVGYKHLLAVDYRLPSDRTDSTILPRLSISNTTTFESIMIQINMAFKKTGF